MKCSLVIGRHTIDDFPIRLFKTRKAAERFAAKLDQDSEEYYDMLVYANMDASDPVCLAIIDFDEKGRPLSLDVPK